VLSGRFFYQKVTNLIHRGK